MTPCCDDLCDHSINLDRGNICEFQAKNMAPAVVSRVIVFSKPSTLNLKENHEKELEEMARKEVPCRFRFGRWQCPSSVVSEAHEKEQRRGNATSELSKWNEDRTVGVGQFPTPVLDICGLNALIRLLS